MAQKRSLTFDNIGIKYRHILGGEGVKNLPNLPMDSSKKIPTEGGRGSKIVNICRRLKWMVPWSG